mgnify:CR=1 FL=1
MDHRALSIIEREIERTKKESNRLKPSMDDYASKVHFFKSRRRMLGAEWTAAKVASKGLAGVTA